MSNNSGEPSGLFLFGVVIWMITQPITYVMTAIRWFSTPYDTF
jgi:hypothetical protein